MDKSPRFASHCTGTIFTFLLLLSGLCQTGYAQLDKAKLDAFFIKLKEKNKAMGGIQIDRAGVTIYQQNFGYGWIDQGKQIPLSAATRYRVGSVTKMFTATLIFQLIEKGKLKLDDPLSRFFPALPAAGKITIAQILEHRSGIHDVSSDAEFRAWRYKQVAKEDILALMVKAKPDFEPGTAYNYSNSGYFLLGWIVEKLSGISYAEILKKNITTVIGLNDTYVNSGSLDRSKNESFSYRYNTSWEPVPETHPDLLFGSGSLISTTGDLACFIKALFDGRLVSVKSLEVMKQQQMGMESFPYEGITFYGHTGGIDGFGTWLVYQPEEKLSVSYATNGKVYPVAKIIEGVMTIYRNKSFEIPEFEAIEISTEVLERYTGTYSSAGAPVKFKVRREGNVLFLQMNEQAPLALEAVTEDKFKIEAAGITLVFDAEKKQMSFNRNDRQRIFTREN